LFHRNTAAVTHTSEGSLSGHTEQGAARMKMSSECVRPLAIVLYAAMLLVTGPGILCQTWTTDNGDGTYSNPLFFDEFSDPDMIRVGSDFYLTGTTMHSMPGLPILHSKDLVNWDFVAYAM